MDWAEFSSEDEIILNDDEEISHAIASGPQKNQTDHKIQASKRKKSY